MTPIAMISGVPRKARLFRKMLMVGFYSAVLLIIRLSSSNLDGKADVRFTFLPAGADIDLGFLASFVDNVHISIHHHLIPTSGLAHHFG